MSRGITIDTKHTYNDWDLILKSQEIGIPKAKTNYVDIPGGNGTIDLTEALTGEVLYEGRDGSFVFDLLCSPAERAAVIASFGSFIHGRKRTITLPDDPDYYYVGRMEIKEYKTAGMLGEIEIKTFCEPYKYKKDKTVVQGPIGVGGSLALNCANTRKKAIPEITVSAAVSITFDGSTYALEAGTHTITNIILVEGSNNMSITGTNGTTVKFEYQEGAL